MDQPARRRRESRAEPQSATQLTDRHKKLFELLDPHFAFKFLTSKWVHEFIGGNEDASKRMLRRVTQLAYNELRNDVQKVQSTLTIVERELDLKDAAGSFLMRIRPYRTLQNVVDGVVITFSDLTANKQAQRTKELLIEELQHRTRNLLAIVQSISDATLAASGSLDDYAAEFNNRLQALSRVQGILSRQEDDTVMLTEILQAELTGVGVTPDGERIVIGGPPVTLPRETTQLLALAIHELATNALKHGALKNARGRLNVKWRVLDQTGQPHLQLTWLESDVEFGEQKAGSLRQGFGQELLEKAIPYQLGATTRFELLKDGMRWWLDMPLRKYEQREL